MVLVRVVQRQVVVRRRLVVQNPSGVEAETVVVVRMSVEQGQLRDTPRVVQLLVFG